jgi:bifunctional non-homologous end joining protein LigD
LQQHEQCSVEVIFVNNFCASLGEKVREYFKLIKREVKNPQGMFFAEYLSQYRIVEKTMGLENYHKKRDFRRMAEPNRDINTRIGRDVVALTNLDKVYWPDDNYTKGDLIRYYYEVSKYILPYLKDRPLILKRYPSGIQGQSFHQHDVDEVPDYIRTVALEVEDSGGGHTVDYVVGGKLATLLYTANLGAIECHPWHSRTRNLDRPDWFVFDLDPGKGIAFETICELALCVREVLSRSGLEGYPKTSGSRGMHIYVPIKPIYSYERVANFAEQIATAIAREMPEAATVERSLKKRRRGQIYIDHMQNARGKSVASAYSIRPKPGATVSAPLNWNEVKRKKIKPQDFTIRNLLRRIEKKGDMFKEVLNNRQTLPKVLK